MSNIIPVPTMSTLGWVTDPASKFDFLLSHFFLSDYNQTYLYKGYVASLPKIIETNGNNIDGAIYDLRSSLNNYLTRYYDQVEVEVVLVTPLKENDPSVELNINIGVTDAGTKNIYGRLLSTVNGKMDKLIKINNNNTSFQT